ncbi:MAG: PP2C family protein-serine/threonine phosphatase [Blastocatellia bacterium]
MSHSGFSGPLAAGVALAVQPSPLPRKKSGKRSRYQELELKLAAIQKDYADMHGGLFEASQVYRRLCAPRLVRHGGFEIASETFAARHLPGDFFTVEERGNLVILALGDISGKGLAAGMWTTLLLGLVAMHSAKTAEPQAIITGVNRDLCWMPLGAPLASLFLARLDTETGILDYCSAGHPPTLLLRADGQLESLSEGGPLLGVVPEASFVSGSATLRLADILLAYSDGILEARNDADQEFGFEHLEAQLRRARSGSADAVLFSLLGAVQDFAGPCAQADDMSLVVIRRSAPQVNG